jgi:hypothetical protein
MKNIAGILGVVAGAAAVATILLYKREDGSRLTDGLMDSARDMGSRARNYASQLKDRLLHNVHGPNGEAVFIDMYDRQFYEDGMGHRVYLES